MNYVGYESADELAIICVCCVSDGLLVLCKRKNILKHLSSAVSFSNSCKTAVRLLRLIMFFFPFCHQLCHIRFAVKVKEHSNPNKDSTGSAGVYNFATAKPQSVNE